MAVSDGSESQDNKAQAILKRVYDRAADSLNSPVVTDGEIRRHVELLCRHMIGADVRVLMACLLAHLTQPEVDIRKPYTKLGDGSFGGRGYDERYISDFITEHGLPCIRTTGFLTPAFRAKNVTLARTVELEGSSPELSNAFLDVLDSVHSGAVADFEVFVEIVRQLLLVRDEQQSEIDASLTRLKEMQDRQSISAEQIITLVRQHLASPYSSRLPVLVIAAAYSAASSYLGEHALPLQSHTAADKQTGALGDVEITLVSDSNVITTYEVKDRRVTRNDIDLAVIKVTERWRALAVTIDNYIFITTDRIDDDVQDYAATLYSVTGGTEFVVLDCIGFLRHFLHLFHRQRMRFLETYQALVLAEPESAVRHELKMLLLALRRASGIPGGGDAAERQ
ncbi:MAG: DNA methyltransferase [Ktedonobacteraceae bacterium]